MRALRWCLLRAAAVTALTAVILVSYALLARPQVRPASAVQPFTLEGYLHTASDEVVFVYLGRSGGAVTGTLTSVYVDSSSPHQLQRASGRFRGHLAGSRIVFSDPGTSGPVQSWAGTLSGARLVLTYPDGQGTTTTFVFRRSSVAAFNSAVGGLQARSGASF